MVVLVADEEVGQREEGKDEEEGVVVGIENKGGRIYIFV